MLEKALQSVRLQSAQFGTAELQRWAMNMQSVLLLLTLMLPIVSCGAFFGTGPYNDLEALFKNDKPLKSKPIASRTIVLTSLKHRGAYNYQDVVDIRLAPGAIEFDPSLPMMASILIPIDSITGCSKTCFGSSTWDADLIIGVAGTQVSIARSQEVIEWCWENKLPMISGKDRIEWKYNKGTLPEKSNYSKQLSSRKEYDYQTKKSCLGY